MFFRIVRFVDQNATGLFFALENFQSVSLFSSFCRTYALFIVAFGLLLIIIVSLSFWIGSEDELKEWIGFRNFSLLKRKNIQIFYNFGLMICFVMLV